MTDEELIARLREGLALENYIAAADRIETLTAEVAKLTRSLDIAVQTISESGRLRGQAEAERDAAVDALREMLLEAEAGDVTLHVLRDARATLANIKEGKL